MTPAVLYRAINLPDTCHLGKRVFKKLFFEHAKLTPADRRALNEDLETVVWQYTLKPSTLPIQPYVDDVHEYLEIAILEVRLRQRRSAARIAEIIHRAIPYPLVIVLAEGSCISISVAHKRFSRVERGAVIAEGFLHSGWLEGDNRTGLDEAFLDSLALDSLPQTNYRSLYAAIVERVLAFECGSSSGRFCLAPERTEEERRMELAQCRGLAREIIETRAAIHTETSFARQVELNGNIQSMEQKLVQAKARL